MPECKCIIKCQRWGYSQDGTCGYFVPYNPLDERVCKQLIYKNMKPHTVVKVVDYTPKQYYNESTAKEIDSEA